MRKMVLFACILFAISTIINFAEAASAPNDAKLQSLADGAKTRGQQYQLDTSIIPNDQKTKASPQYNQAQKAYDVVQSPKRQAEVEFYREQLQSGVFAPAGKAVSQSFYSDLKTTSQKKSAGLASDERIYILISSSVPVDTLRAYAEDLAILGNENIRMVIRGFIDGPEKIGPTMNFLSSVLNKNPQACRDSIPTGGRGCDSYEAIIDIDPNIFRRYAPEAVPAIVYVKGVHPNMPEASEGSEDIVGPLDDKNVMVLYGDASLSYALELFAREGGGKQLQVASDLIRRQ